MAEQPHQIFISYSRQDVDFARRLMAAFGARGWTVFLDARMPGGIDWQDELDAAIDAARAVVVIWSARSMQSDHVRSEVARAYQRGTLVPVRMEAIEPPAAFARLQCVDLSSWNGADCPPELMMALEARFSGQPLGIAQNEAERRHAEIDAKLDAVLARLDASGTTARAADDGLARDTILKLARRLRPEETLDFERAVAEVERAVDVALDLIRAGQRGSNADAFVDAVLRRVAQRVRQADFDGAAHELDAELLKIDERAQQLDRDRVILLERAIEVDIVRRNPQSAAKRILHLTTLKHPYDRVAKLEAMSGQWNQYRDEGVQRGINLSLDIAIGIARLALSICATSDELGDWHSAHAVALSQRGERDSGPNRLTEAVAANRAALEEHKRERTPLKWAMIQMNLGNALANLGERETGTGRLEEAASAYREALKEYTRKRSPLDWARTQMNLGCTLTSLGERGGGTAYFEEAVLALRAALEERTRVRAPLEWASAQLNLGNVLRILGERESGTARLEEAVAAFRAVLEVHTRERTPLLWAGTQMNLGGALVALGARESGTERFREAASIYRAALEETTRDRVPIEWARMQWGLGIALAALGAREGGTERLQEAISIYRAVLEELTRARAPHYHDRVRHSLAAALTLLNSRRKG